MPELTETSETIAGLPPRVSEQVEDCQAYGEVEVESLHPVQLHGGKFLHRNWVSIPHVTHHDDVDVTALMAFREKLVPGDGRKKPSLPILLIKALTEVFKEYPRFNASLSADGGKVLLKKYFNIGMAVDTPNGLLVPVLKQADRKTVFELADELAELASTAISKGLPMDAMEGSSFTISSIGNLGGTGFTPIINAPDVAILGLTRVFDKPLRGENDELVWRPHVPVSLSYDHRVINGADAASFISRLAEICQQPETFLE